MKTTLLILCMAIMGAISHTAIAQGTTPNEKARTAAEKLAQEFGLDKKQQEKVFEANLMFENAVTKLSATLSPAEKQAKIEALRKEQLNKLKNVLKPEQYELVAARLNSESTK